MRTGWGLEIRLGHSSSSFSWAPWFDWCNILIGRWITRRRFLSGALGGCIIANCPNFTRAAESNGIDLRGYGVNCFDLFLGRLLGHQNVRSPGVRLHELSSLGIPFVRFPVSVFWADEWRHYLDNKARYYDLLDEIVWVADKHNVRLLPVLAWNPSSISDLVSEPFSAWGSDGSKTVRFANAFFEELMDRYKRSAAVGGWEFSNELNTFSDLQNGYKWRPPINPRRGTPSQRTEANNVSLDLIARSVARFAAIAKARSPRVLLSGGFDAPRYNAYSLSQGRHSRDTFEELLLNQQKLNESLRLLSVHYYPFSEGSSDVMMRGGDISDLEMLVRAARQLEKELFIGEFGVKKSDSHAKDKYKFERMLDYMVSANVRIAALWVYDYFPMLNDWSVGVGGARSYQLDLIARMNSKIV